MTVPRFTLDASGRTHAYLEDGRIIGLTSGTGAMFRTVDNPSATIVWDARELNDEQYELVRAIRAAYVAQWGSSGCRTLPPRCPPQETT